MSESVDSLEVKSGREAVLIGHLQCVIFRVRAVTIQGSVSEVRIGTPACNGASSRRGLIDIRVDEDVESGLADVGYRNYIMRGNLPLEVQVVLVGRCVRIPSLIGLKSAAQSRK